MTHNSRTAILGALTGLLLAWMLAPSVAQAAEDILDACGVRGGLVVCVGCDNPESLVALRPKGLCVLGPPMSGQNGQAPRRNWTSGVKLVTRFQRDTHKCLYRKWLRFEKVGCH